MTVGSLGGVSFSASGERIVTPYKMSRSGSVNWAKHARAGGTTLLERASDDAETATLHFKLVSATAADVSGELRLLEEYKRIGAVLPLELGNEVLGRWRWVISSLSYEVEAFDITGAPAVADVTVNLTEYLDSAVVAAQTKAAEKTRRPVQSTGPGGNVAGSGLIRWNAEAVK